MIKQKNILFFWFFSALNCRKQEAEFESALTDLLNDNLTFIDQSFSSSILTSIIEDLILRSTLANDYLASQFLIINQIEYSLPFIRNIELENDLLNKNETFLSTNPFVDFNDLEDYLNRCERKFIFTYFIHIVFLLIRYDNNHSMLSYSTVSYVLSNISSSTSILLSSSTIRHK
jgi:hypothetical protein